MSSAEAREHIVEQANASARHLSLVLLGVSIRLLGSQDPAAVPAAREIAAVARKATAAAVRVGRIAATAIEDPRAR